MFIKGVKKTQEVKEKKTTISNDIINKYCTMNNIDKKSVHDALELFGDAMISELKSFEKMINQK